MKGEEGFAFFFAFASYGSSAGEEEIYLIDPFLF
jgi:hypothetical protein